MEPEEQQLMHRFSELARRAFARGRYEYSPFLDLAQQEILSRMRWEAGSAPVSLWGGYDAAERRMAVFGDAALCGYEADPPAVWLCCAPVAAKFADALTHRDFLGALMSLGVRRDTLGDILLSENSGYLLCAKQVADFLTENLTQIKRTTVRCVGVEAPPVLLSAPPDPQELVVASERLDAVIAAVYTLSRAESQALFAQGRVFVNSRAVENTSAQLAAGEIVSVRGHGRFVYEGILRETKKNRLRVIVRVY